MKASTLRAAALRAQLDKVQKEIRTQTVREDQRVLEVRFRRPARIVLLSTTALAAIDAGKVWQ